MRKITMIGKCNMWAGIHMKRALIVGIDLLYEAESSHSEVSGVADYKLDVNFF